MAAMRAARQNDRNIKCIISGFYVTVYSDHADTDPWMMLPGDDFPDVTKQALPFQVTNIEGVLPLNTQIGVFPKKTVPDALYEPLFGQNAQMTIDDSERCDTRTGQPMHSYAILDAAKVINLPERIERSGLEYRCLFSGRAYDDLKNVAPWIVRLEEGNSFTRSLFTRSNASWNAWDNEPGIFFRSSAAIMDLQRHFRRFTRVKDVSGTWYLFRFWDPAVAQVHFLHIFENPHLWRNWLVTASGEQIKSLIICRASGMCTFYTLTEAVHTPEQRVFFLSQEEINKLRQNRMERSYENIARRLLKNLPQETFESLRNTTQRVAVRFVDFGFRQKSSIFALTWYELHHGPNFERYLDKTVLRSLNDKTKDEERRISELRNFLDNKQRGYS